MAYNLLFLWENIKIKYLQIKETYLNRCTNIVRYFKEVSYSYYRIPHSHITPQNKSENNFRIALTS